VDTEWNVNKNNDYFKNLQILKNMSKKDHPFAKFGMGNQNTLKGGLLLQKTKEHFEEYFRWK
jgi:secreted Zn-dependent insulinase-like peptidase